MLTKLYEFFFCSKQVRAILNEYRKGNIEIVNYSFVHVGRYKQYNYIRFKTANNKVFSVYDQTGNVSEHFDEDSTTLSYNIISLLRLFEVAYKDIQRKQKIESKISQKNYMEKNKKYLESLIDKAQF